MSNACRQIILHCKRMQIMVHNHAYISRFIQSQNYKTLQTRRISTIMNSALTCSSNALLTTQVTQLIGKPPPIQYMAIGHVIEVATSPFKIVASRYLCEKCRQSHKVLDIRCFLLLRRSWTCASCWSPPLENGATAGSGCPRATGSVLTSACLSWIVDLSERRTAHCSVGSYRSLYCALQDRIV